MADDVLTVAVRAGDTLPALALRYLGSATRWPEIAAANHLQYPFIADDAAAKLGPPIATGRLALPLISGSLLTLQTIPAVIRNGVVVAITTVLADGAHTDIRTARVLNLQQRTIQLDAAPMNTCLAGQLVVFYNPDADRVSTVAIPGDTLLIENPAGATVVPGPTFIQALGIDLDVQSQPGFLVYTAAGDVQTVSGTATMQQAVANALQTPLGAAPLSPLYGSRLQAAVAATNGPALPILVVGAIREALAQDPRIADVTDVQVTQDGEIVSVSFNVVLDNTSAVLAVTNLTIGV